MTNHRGASALVMAALLLVAGFSPASSVASESPEAPIFTLPIASFVECGECFQICGGPNHALDTSEGPDRTYNEDDHPCEPEWCSIAHPQGGGACSTVSLENVNQAWMAAQVGDSDEDLVELLNGGFSARYNADRGAIQVEGCQGGIILTVPLTEDQIKALEN